MVEVDRRRYAVCAAVPGDRLKVAFTGAELTVGDEQLPLAEVREVIGSSRDRVTPACGLIERCGGCALQQMAYPAQLRAKTAALRAALQTLGVEPSRVAPTRGLSAPYGYRTKLMMPASMAAGNVRPRCATDCHFGCNS